VAEGTEVKKCIDNEMLAVQKKVMESNKGSLFGRFMNWGAAKTSAVSLAGVWHKLAQNSSVNNYKCLVQEMSALKKREEVK
jgi:hypothetical protein